ncbi:hypothetical protein P280DRAFT_440093 [Massarina eburnea CBS 473.64]|uniref:WD40 repeat-like protein n=1 Tax=Massarina eburnea CBS 473.64 TaxID=1395130 RepID=A0A6A6SEP4_9PLEO|nr:hypothetical protein P280DRAFT_440093 [Massarina eburnea CBS 473.64]
MASITSLQSLILDLPPSCIEFCPLNPQYAVVGTYNLEKQPTDRSGDENEQTTEDVEEPKPQERNGSIILVKVHGDSVLIVQTLATPFAVLDIHFAPDQNAQSLFGVASSTGSIGLYQLADHEDNGLDQGSSKFIRPRVTHVQTFNVADPEILVTAFLWHPRKGGSNGHSLVACLSLSDGSIAMGAIEPKSTTSDVAVENITCHDLEAWTVALTLDGTGIYSGGDDSGLMFSGLAEHSPTLWPGASDFKTTPRTAWKDQKTHFAGVTAILPLQTTSSESLIVTGSYDDNIRLISVPTSGRRRAVAELNLGGGVWRLKRLDLLNKPSPARERDSQDVLILASCMHAGARIVRLHHSADEDEWRFEVLAKFEEHKSMNYGSDCQPKLNDKGQRTFITTSFYDRLLCFWRH